MYKYHNFVYNYSIAYANAPQLMPLPAVPYLKDSVTNLIENSIRRSVGTPSVSYNYSMPAQLDYSIYSADTDTRLTINEKNNELVEAYDLMGLSA